MLSLELKRWFAPLEPQLSSSNHRLHQNSMDQSRASLKICKRKSWEDAVERFMKYKTHSMLSLSFIIKWQLFSTGTFTQSLNTYKFYNGENNTQLFCHTSHSLKWLITMSYELFLLTFYDFSSSLSWDCQQLSLFPLLPEYPVASLFITMCLRAESLGCKQSNLRSISAGVAASIFTRIGDVVTIEFCFTIRLFVSPHCEWSSVGDCTFVDVFFLSRSFVSAALCRHFTDKVFCRPVEEIQCKFFVKFY